MKNEPLVSVIIPTYNRAHLIGETLDSVLAQTYQNWECIIVDDGSSDNTDEVVGEYVKKDSRFKYYHRPEEHLPGGNGARNYGFKMSQGKYVNWFDSDDLMHIKKLKIQVNSIQKKNFKIHVAQSSFFSQIPKDNYDDLWSTNLVTSRYRLSDSLILDNVRWPTGAVLWSRHFIEKQKWKECLKGAQEWHFHCMASLILDFDDFSQTQKILTYVRRDNNSITRSDNITIRFNSYLKARILLLNYLFDSHSDLFLKYFNILYSFSLKYVKILIIENKFVLIYLLGKLIFKVSFIKATVFYYGVIIFKTLKKDFFLKKVI